jgi:hypothetical protein
VTVACQLAFTYLPALQYLFDSRSLTVSEGAIVIAIGAVLLAVVEIEKQVRLRFGGRRPLRNMKEK